MIQSEKLSAMSLIPPLDELTNNQYHVDLDDILDTYIITDNNTGQTWPIGTDVIEITDLFHKIATHPNPLDIKITKIGNSLFVCWQQGPIKKEFIKEIKKCF